MQRSVPKDVKTIISELPKFSVPKKDGKIDVFHLPSDDQGKFVTETLAEIYLKQALWDKAINAYEVLSLKSRKKVVSLPTELEKLRNRRSNDSIVYNPDCCGLHIVGFDRFGSEPKRRWS